MNAVRVTAKSKQEAFVVCRQEFGWTPDAVRKVDSGNAKDKAYLCFESARDAETWDTQR